MATGRSITKFSLALSLLLPLSTAAGDAPGVLRPGDHYPNACYLIFEDKNEAARLCPLNVKIVEFHDFWGSFRGWTCDCANAEQPEDDGSEPADEITEVASTNP